MNDGRFCFGKILPDTWGFYDVISDSETVSDEQLHKAGFAFKIWVTLFPIKKGTWKIISHQHLTSDEQEPQYFYKQDRLNNKLWKTLTGDDKAPVSIEECELLEIAAVYDPEHVLERLEYHFRGEEDPGVAYHKKRLREKGVPTR